MYVVTIYVVEGCRFCDDAKSALYAMGGIRVVEIRATQRIRKALEDKTGCTTLPSVWIGGVYIGGLNTGPAPFGGLVRFIAKDLWYLARRNEMTNPIGRLASVTE
jgi:glutaredoxin